MDVSSHYFKEEIIIDDDFELKNMLQQRVCGICLRLWKSKNTDFVRNEIKDGNCYASKRIAIDKERI